jgi:ABC-2 type transporter
VRRLLPRWYILKTLLHKELLRLLNNRGGLIMSGVMIIAAVFASAFGDASFRISGTGPTTVCYVDHWQDDGWVAHLRSHVPEHLGARIRFRSVASRRGTISYPPGTAGIQLRPVDGGRFKVWIWYPDGDGASTAPFEAWFWHETQRYLAQHAGVTPPASAITANGRDGRFWADAHQRFAEQLTGHDLRVRVAEVERSRLKGQRVNLRSGAAMFLVLMALCFVCIFLMPSATAEERERGALLAQALSPASSLEILGAKLLFYPTLAVALASLVTGICRPAALRLPFFWLALGITALGTVGIGLTLSVLARTQRAASMSALSYMLAVALLLLVSRANGLEFPAVVMIENHGPRMLLAALNGTVEASHWGQLAISWVLAVVWCGLATGLFRRFGWQ